MPEMFTRAMKVLYLCYKQIFPFLATAVNGPTSRGSGSAGEGTVAWTKQRGNTWQPFNHVVLLRNLDCCLTFSKK